MSERRVYFGSWKSREDMEESYSDSDYKDGKYVFVSPVPADAEILLASYGGGSYEGYSVVVFRQNGKLYETHGSHCSCYGLDGQWSPEEATIESLKKTVTNELKYEHESDALIAFGQLIAELEGR